ncbi:hypothetical protein RJT34_10423 [Clitoria ternatea]|uniref:Integrator complex subunit 3 N-terminal domain-containing protein n=1 Tax=Clitoria ternatea TaxID=43366 RepID=A0AAN9K801_CLITE
MVSRLTHAALCEPENPIEVSLRQSFESLQSTLTPPFSLTIPKPGDEYSHTNLAILHAILTEPHFAVTHIKHLHAVVTDGYATFIDALFKIVHFLYPKLLASVKSQVLWVAEETVRVLGIGFDAVLVTLLRQIIGGDFSDGNCWLCLKLVTLFSNQRQCLLDEAPHVLSFALYTFLRVLSDHCRVGGDENLEALRRMEINLCVMIVRLDFRLCLNIGRDFIRLLQDLLHVPEFKGIWMDIVVNPSAFNALGFVGVSQIYRTRTSSRYHLLRISPEMETQLRFLLTHVKLGHQKKHQIWFARKFLNEPERDCVIVDIVRFVCCGHHPPNEIIQSDVVPRWAFIGWLLKLCRKSYLVESVKLALFYDWLFFDERVDKIMNIEPAVLLMVHSIPNYADMTNSLLEFLLKLLDDYDLKHKDLIVEGVSSAFKLLVSKGVIPSLDVLTSSPVISPVLKGALGRLLSGVKVESSNACILARISASPKSSHICP